MACKQLYVIHWGEPHSEACKSAKDTEERAINYAQEVRVSCHRGHNIFSWAVKMRKILSTGGKSMFQVENTT